MKRNITLYCGSKTGNLEILLQEVFLFCDLLIDNGFNLVYGGSHRGMMGEISKRFLNAGREVYGVRPKHYVNGENYKGELTEMFITENLFERKQKMIELSDVLVALPGGIGTLDEITEAHCFINMYKTPKFVGIFNPFNFYEGLLEQYRNMEKYGFSSTEKLENIQIDSNAHQLMEKILTYETKFPK